MNDAIRAKAILQVIILIPSEHLMNFYVDSYKTFNVDMSDWLEELILSYERNDADEHPQGDLAKACKLILGEYQPSKRQNRSSSFSDQLLQKVAQAGLRSNDRNILF